MKKPTLILIVLVLIISALFVARAVVSNKLSTSGVVLGATQDRLREYRTENALIREKIFGLSSLNYVASAASKMGFVEGKDTFALTRGVPLARKE